MYYNIQILRGFSALLVVAFHLLPHFRDMGLHSFLYESIAQYGYIGVDIFFVISGFVMAHTLRNETYGFDSAILFIKKRLLRIYSGYLPAFIFAFLIYKVFMPDFLNHISLLKSFSLTTIDMQKLLIGTSWSLSYEVYFYFFLTIILLQRKIKATFVLNFILIIIIMKNFLNPEVNDEKLSDFLLSHLMIEFIIGYLLYQFMDFIRQGKYLLVIVPCLIVSLIFGVSIIIENNWTRVITFGVFSFCLIWLLVYLELKKIRLRKGLLLQIGDASYSLYLLHIVFVNLFFSSGFRNYIVDNNFALIGFIFYYCLIVIISLLFYKFIEYPLHQILRKRVM